MLPNCSNTVNTRLPEISSCLQSSDCSGFLFWLPFGCPRLLRSEKTAGAAQSAGATSATAVLGVAILAQHIEQCVNLKYGNTAHARYAKTLPLLQATKRALGSAAALLPRCTACAAATRARTAARARNGILFFGKCSLSVQEHFCKFCQCGTFKSARDLKLCDVPDFLRPFSEFISNAL